MSRKEEPSPGASPARACRVSADGRDQQEHGKYTHHSKQRKAFDYLAYCRRIERKVIPDAIAKLSGWPYRYKYFVDQSGQLRRRPIRRAEA